VRPNTAPERVPDDPVRVEFEVRFSRGPKRRRRLTAPSLDEKSPASTSSEDGPHAPAPTSREGSLRPVSAPERIPKITRLLVLGHHFERLVRDGIVKSYAEIARMTGLSRARVTQIVNLTLMAPDIQDDILFLPPDTSGRELTYRPNLWRLQLAPE